jgi:hypothetical protein
MYTRLTLRDLRFQGKSSMFTPLEIFHNNSRKFICNNNNHLSLLSLWNLKIMKDTLRLLSFHLHMLPYTVTITYPYLYRFLLFHNYFNNVCVYHLYYTRSSVLIGLLHINHSCLLPLPPLTPSPILTLPPI